MRGCWRGKSSMDKSTATSNATEPTSATGTHIDNLEEIAVQDHKSQQLGWQNVPSLKRGRAVKNTTTRDSEEQEQMLLEDNKGNYFSSLQEEEEEEELEDAPELSSKRQKKEPPANQHNWISRQGRKRKSMAGGEEVPTIVYRKACTWDHQQ